jgi:pimeloyl-ACP methyl ester carboxylesterase
VSGPFPNPKVTAPKSIIQVLEPPPRSGLVREARGVIELPRLLFRISTLARQPRGNGEPVLVLPGYGSGNASTALLQSYLRFLGYRVRGWGRGSNKGEVPTLLTRVLKRLVSLARRNQQKVRIVGWSLGGYLAREAARERPDLVQQVITLGTPVVGGPKYTVMAQIFRRRGIDIDAIEAEIESRNQISLTTPVTAIYSRRDNVVAWEACIDHFTSDVEHIEVKATHLGLGFSPEVYKIIAERLAQGNGPSLDRPRDPSTRRIKRLLGHRRA